MKKICYNSNNNKGLNMSKLKEELAKIYSNAVDRFDVVSHNRLDQIALSNFREQSKILDSYVDQLSARSSCLLHDALSVQNSINKLIDENAYLDDIDVRKERDNIFDDMANSYLKLTSDFSAASDRFYDVFVDYRIRARHNKDQFNALMERLRIAGVDVKVIHQTDGGLNGDIIKLALSSSDYQKFCDVINDYKKELNRQTPALEFVDDLSVYFVPPFLNSPITVDYMRERFLNAENPNNIRYNYFGLASTQIYGDNYLSMDSLKDTVFHTFKIMLSNPASYHNFTKNPYVYSDNVDVSLREEVKRSSLVKELKRGSDSDLLGEREKKKKRRINN